MNKAKFEANGSQLTVTRTFDARIDLIWRAWTEADLLDQWWAPKPWKSETSFMEFKEGGYRLYAIVGPKGERHLARTDYLSIQMHRSFTGEDAFCDDQGNIIEELPVAKFANHYEVIDDQTAVTVISEYASPAHLKQVIEMGMKEGLTMAYENLDALIGRFKGAK